MKTKKKNKNKKPRIRPVALCVFRRGDKIFVSAGYNTVKDEIFYRPIGGKIEFGEYGEDTIHREVREEIEAEVADIVYLGTLENIFVYNDQAGHEILRIYDGRFVDERFNDDDIVVRGTDDHAILFDATWKTLDFFRAETAAPLYPTGLLALLDAGTN